MRTLTATAQNADDGRLLKYYLRSELKLSSRQLSNAKFSGGLRVNGVEVRVDYALSPGDAIEVALFEGSSRVVPMENMPVAIPWGDQDVFIVDKLAPLPCQSTPKQPTGTLENRLAYQFRDRGDFVFRPVNRLDKGTSGLMAVALHPYAFRRLQTTLHTPSFIREYLAVVEGNLAGEGTIDLSISKENAASVKRVVDLELGKPSVTHYEALAHGNDRTLVRLRLETGRTHQIRVHLSAIGHPITGDFLYGKETDELPGRFALHSALIAFDHPVTGERIEQTSALPEALSRLV